MDLAKLEVQRNCEPSWERIVLQEEPGGPVIRIRKNIEKSCFEADFAIDLLGVVKEREHGDYRGTNQESPASGNERLLNSLLTGLNVGQEIAFVYRTNKDEQGHNRLAWRIRGRSSAGASEDAENGAKILWRNLNIITGSLSREYSFAPVTNPELLCSTNTKKEWVGTVRPVGVAVDSGRKVATGFLREECEEKTNVIVIPQPEKRADACLDSVISAALSCHEGVEVVYAITPVTLSSQGQAKVADALKWLNNGEPKKINYAGNGEEGLEEEAVLKGLQTSLGSWLKSPFGHRTTCTALSDGPIPASFMSLLAGTFNCPVSVIMKRNCTENLCTAKSTIQAKESSTVDLQDCIKSGVDLPDLFPAVKTLADCGVGKVFRQPFIKTSSTGILLGTMGQDGTGREVRFSRQGRSRHNYIVGGTGTGTGKSTLIFNMISQDIENGEGAALIDPHGDLYEQVLRAIPPHRAKDVILIDPSNFEYSVGINFLECNDFYRPAQINFVVNEMVKIFGRLYDLNMAGGPMFEQYIRHAMLLALENDLDRATLMDVPMIFEDVEFRNYLKKNCYNRLTVSFWNKQAETAGGEASLSNIAPYVTSKLNQFTNNALLRPIIGQTKSSIDFREAMDSGKILLVNLSKGMLGTLDTQLLGMLLIGKILTASMARANMAVEDRRPFFLYVDEFQNFTTDSVSSLLSEARKFGINLILANQTLTQLRSGKGQDVLDSVLGNAGNIMILRSGIMDSEKLEMYTKPELASEDLQEMPDFHVAGRLLINNSPTRPFVFKTMPAKYLDSGKVDEIRAHSMAKYARPTAWVEKDIVERYCTIQHEKDHNMD